MKLLNHHLLDTKSVLLLQYFILYLSHLNHSTPTVMERMHISEEYIGLTFEMAHKKSLCLQFGKCVFQEAIF